MQAENTDTSPKCDYQLQQFTGRGLVIATMHGKERVIAPGLEDKLGVTCFVPANFNSDLLGSFTGEYLRSHDALSTARMKCLKAMEVTGCGLGIASEGSFGPHPALWFCPADEEILIFIDKENDLEISVRELSTATNFDGAEIKNENELYAFAERAGFPDHALILRKSPRETAGIVKGICDRQTLTEAFYRLQKENGSVYAETDMRAMHNPMRMKVIATAASKLLERICSLCPQCAAPGFGATGRRAGLPCSNCRMPTRSTLAEIWSCQKCGHQHDKLFPASKEQEDPMYCDFCNP